MSDLEPSQRENVAEANQLIREAGYRDKASWLDDKLQDNKIKHDPFLDPTTNASYTGFPFYRINLNPNIIPLRRLTRTDPDLLRLASTLLHEADHGLGHDELDCFGEQIAFYKILNRDFNRYFPGTTPAERTAIETAKAALEREKIRQRNAIARRGGTGYGDGYEQSEPRAASREQVNLEQPVNENPRSFPDRPGSVVREQMERVANGLFRYRDFHGSFPLGSNSNMVAALRGFDPTLFRGGEIDQANNLLDPGGAPYVYRSPGVIFPEEFDLYSLGPCKKDHDGAGDNILCELHRE